MSIVKIAPGIPLVESPFFSSHFNETYQDRELLTIAKELHEYGLAVIDFPDEDFNTLAENIKVELQTLYDWDRYKNGAGVDMRIQDAWKTNASVNKIAVNHSMINILSKLFGREAFPFQTLNFPVGTTQHFHSDSIHFSSIPERFMCGVWVALEDVEIGSGPLEYYPGSHKLPIYTHEQLGIDIRGNHKSQVMYHAFWEELIRFHNFERKVFYAKKGQAVIWLANLLHGGYEEIDRTKTRWSQVTHYYFENCTYFSPIRSTPMCGSVEYRLPPNIAKGGAQVNNYSLGKVIDNDIIHFQRLLKSREELVLPDDFNPAKYLALNPDVLAAGADATAHWVNFGKRENRTYK